MSIDFPPETKSDDVDVHEVSEPTLFSKLHRDEELKLTQRRAERQYQHPWSTEKFLHDHDVSGP
jgi:hypothetical protein